MTEVNLQTTSNQSQPNSSTTPHSTGSITPELLEYDEFSHLSYSLSSLPSIQSETFSFDEVNNEEDEEQEEEEEDEDSSEVTVNRPIRSSDYTTQSTTIQSTSQSEPASSIPTSPQPTRAFGLPSSNSGPHSPHFHQPIERYGSPISLSSWNPSEGLSYPSSSISGSLDSDRELSDHEHETGSQRRNGPLTDGEVEEEIANDSLASTPFDDSHHMHTSTREYLSRITGHLVMPRLPIHHPISNASSRGSSLRGGSSPRSMSSASLRRLNAPETGHAEQPSHHTWTTRAGPKPRVLLFEDGKSSVCKPMVGKASALTIRRARDLVSDFKINDSATHDALLSQISASFGRLRPLLNMRALHPTNSSGQSSQDLSLLIENWIMNEAYMVALVEMSHAPVSSVTLSFLLALSRLIPVQPFISNKITGTKSPIDLHAILTRQFAAKRINHLPIPSPKDRSSSHHDLPLPAFDDCLFRSRECCLNWLLVDEAAWRAIETRTSHTLDPSPEPSHLGLDLEPDRWSEKVGSRVLHLMKQSPRLANTRAKPALVQVRRSGYPNCSRLMSSDPMGMPSLSAILQLGFSHLKINLIKIFQGVLVKASVLSNTIKSDPHTSQDRVRRKMKIPRRVVGQSARQHISPTMKHPWILITFATAATVLTVWGCTLLCG
ncbi:uncharacterized protein MELLADRAFT_117929 [Melampsora larici-populina 98AG31]|uniref:Uncharacterized protein n=1 Tax=Melampsora larici-populina (strain 98AG31 / pathotype 3-4-7) TaxID=747676 RepID=F4S359_MELLP|nr:uncharacterized protein MELLADRAFT_117929 [Melampsora larici-populina 98AG31]EGG00965.1 hypothetical protein MELLADRAFT_117929 [Melampsora larici-populina 98AG31]